MVAIVVDPRQVAHLWANKSQDTARNSGGSLSFTNSAIWSYGSHYCIALHLDDDARSILWNDRHYSSTTARHKSHVHHAMRSGQWQRTIDVPDMGDNEVRNLERLHGSLGTGKVRPLLADQCAARVLSEIETIGTASARATRVMSDAWHDAKRFEASGKFLCAYVAKGKHAPAWPIPALPDTLPTDKDERAALVRSLVKGKLLDEYKAQIAKIVSRVDLTRGHLDLDDDAYELNNVVAHISGAWGNIQAAERAYVSAMGKKPSALAKLRRDVAALEKLATEKKARFDRLHALHAMGKLERDAYKLMRRIREGKATLPSNRKHTDAGYIASKMRDALGALSDSEALPYVALWERLERTSRFESAANNLVRANENMVTGESYGTRYPGDARRHYSEAFEAAKLAQNSDALYAWKSIQIDALLLRSHGMAQQMHEAIAAKHAADVIAWKAGEKQSLPYEAGTYARIQGNEVVTSRGARVPIEHACRLARIARVAIRKGGAEFPQGEGPRVGGFMVQRIGADGSASIGCHDFDAAEGMRLLEVLESCADCKHIKEEAAA